jgi:hypothetical protein
VFKDLQQAFTRLLDMMRDCRVEMHCRDFVEEVFSNQRCGHP